MEAGKDPRKPKEPETTEDFLRQREKARKVNTIVQYLSSKPRARGTSVGQDGKQARGGSPEKRKSPDPGHQKKRSKQKNGDVRENNQTIKEKQEDDGKRGNPTLTQCFAKARARANSRGEEKRMVWKTGFPYYCQEREEFDPDKTYGLYRVRHGQKAHPGECYPGFFDMCQKCKHQNCGLCRIEHIGTMLLAQQEEADRRWKYIEDQTKRLSGGAPLDPDWVREQDPVWGSLVDNNSAMEEDLEKYFADIEAQVASVKRSIGWE